MVDLAAGLSMIKGIFTSLKEGRIFWKSLPNIEIKLDSEKQGYVFPECKLNNHYDHKSICISMKLVNKSSNPVTVEDIYITDMQERMIGRHDPQYTTQFATYRDVMTEPFPKDFRLQADDVASKSIRIPNIDDMVLCDDGSADIKVVVRTAKKSFIESFHIPKYQEENAKEMFVCTSQQFTAFKPLAHRPKPRFARL